MKKLILSAAVLCAGFGAFAQVGTAGFAERFGINPDTDSLYTGHENSIYWWDLDTSDHSGFTFAKERTAEGMKITLDQIEGGYQPFGLSIGEDRIAGTDKRIIDISGDQTFSMSVTNMSDYDLEIRVAPQDINAKSTDIKSDAEAGTLYLSTKIVEVSPNTTELKRIVASSRGSLP